MTEREMQRYLDELFPELNNPEQWRELVREVIRLMEWARQECAEDHGCSYCDPKPADPLTLPPADWQP